MKRLIVSNSLCSKELDGYAIQILSEILKILRFFDTELFTALTVPVDNMLISK
jgi:hypothetical protein